MNQPIVIMDFDGPLRDDDLFFDFDFECIDDVVQTPGRLTSWTEGNTEEEKEWQYFPEEDKEWQDFLREVGELLYEPPLYSVGDNVKAKWGSYFYNVTIVEDMDMAGRYEVQFDTDDTIGRVHQDDIKPRKTRGPPEEDPYHQYASPLTWMPDNPRVLNNWKTLYRKIRFEKVSTVVTTVHECLWDVLENVERVLREQSMDVATACVENILHSVESELDIRSEIRENERQWANARIKLEHEQEEVVFLHVVPPPTIRNMPPCPISSANKENQMKCAAKRKIIDEPLRIDRTKRTCRELTGRRGLVEYN